MAIRSIRVSHIVLSTKDVADLLLDNLKSCESNELMLKMFSKLAKKYSACGTSKKGGDLVFWNSIQPLRSWKKLLCRPLLGKYPVLFKVSSAIIFLSLLKKKK